MSTSQGPKQPLEEKDAEIERLRQQIAEQEKELESLRKWYREWVPVVNDWVEKHA